MLNQFVILAFATLYRYSRRLASPQLLTSSTAQDLTMGVPAPHPQQLAELRVAMHVPININVPHLPANCGVVRPCNVMVRPQQAPISAEASRTKRCILVPDPNEAGSFGPPTAVRQPQFRFPEQRDFWVKCMNSSLLAWYRARFRTWARPELLVRREGKDGLHSMYLPVLLASISPRIGK